MIDEREVIERVQAMAFELDNLSTTRAASEPRYVAAPAAIPPRRRPLLVGAALLVALAVVVTVAIKNTSDNASIAVGAGGPARILLAAPGFAVARHDEQPESNSMHYETDFASADQRLTLHQRPPGYNKEFSASATAAVLGHTANLLVDGSEFRAFWTVGQWDFEFRGSARDEAQFRSELAALHYVDEATWAAALPSSVIKQSDRAAAVAEMVKDMPLPPGIDLAPVANADRTSDRYQLGAQVAGAVFCGWIERWIAATQSGDTAAQQAAVTAMTTARSWQILLDMQAEGAYPQVLWQYVDAVNGAGTVTGGKVLPVADSYRSALGCP